jgi:integrase
VVGCLLTNHPGWLHLRCRAADGAGYAREHFWNIPGPSRTFELGRVPPVANHLIFPKTQAEYQIGAVPSIAARALEFLILTACRTGEVTGARWAEFDLDAGLWTIPPERTKAGKEHRVPLSDPARTIIEVMRAIRQGECVLVHHGFGPDGLTPVGCWTALTEDGRGCPPRSRPSGYRSPRPRR